MRPTTKNTNIFHAQTTKNTKNKTTKKKKQTTTTQLSLLFLSHSRPLYSSHTTHHPTHNTHQPTVRDPASIQGWSIEQHSCCSRHPTACHTTKQTITNQTQTHLLLCKNLYNQQGLKDRKKFLFHQLPKPHTHEMRAVPVFTRKQKLATSQVLTSTHTVTKQILYSP